MAKANTNVAEVTEVQELELQELTPAQQLAGDEEELYNAVFETGTGRNRSGDPDSAFTKFKQFRNTILRVALTKGNKSIPVGRVIQGAVNQKIVAEYRRGYNYHHQTLKSLPEGWVVRKVNDKNHYVYIK